MTPIDLLNTHLARARALVNDVLVGPKAHDERGSLTTEEAMWAGIVVILVGIVSAALTAAVTNAAAQIQ